jgi:hypothetical protein
MAQGQDASLAHQRDRWLRPDWRRYMRPDWQRYLRPDWRDRKYWADPRGAELDTPRGADLSAQQLSRTNWSWTEQHDVTEELAAAQRDLAQLRRLAAELKCELAFRRLARALKANFNPNQPRVPAGNPDGGQWTSEGGQSESTLSKERRVQLAGDIPTPDPRDIPRERPPSAEERTAAIKEVVRRLAKFGGPIGKMIGAAYWLYEYEAEIVAALDPPKSLEELQDAVAIPKAGYQKHHIVEQTSAEEDGFLRSLIDSSGNLVRIPTRKHREITSWYQTNNKDFGGVSPREFLRGKSWEERRQIGIGALIDAGVLKP